MGNRLVHQVSHASSLNFGGGIWRIVRANIASGGPVREEEAAGSGDLKGCRRMHSRRDVPGRWTAPSGVGVILGMDGIAGR